MEIENRKKPPKNEKSHASRSNMPVPTEGNVASEFFPMSKRFSS